MYALLPGFTIALNDDFAYLRSVVATIQHGRPWTDDFLEPWAMSLSVVSAVIFKITGSFFLATVGLQIASAIVSFVVIAVIVRTAACSTVTAITMAASFLTFPTVLWKQCEYTAIVVYLPLLLLSVWAAIRRRWWWFGFFWAAAVASRQSAITWLALPAAAAVEAILVQRSWRRICVPATVTLLGGAWFFLLSRYANQTHAQRLITSELFRSINWHTTGSNAVLAAWVTAAACGVSGLIRGIRVGIDIPTVRSDWARRVAGFLVAGLLLVSVRYVGSGIPLSFEHPIFENEWAISYFRALVVLGAAGWAIAPPNVSWPFALTAAASLSLASVRSELWDYYLIDGVLVAILGVVATTAGQGHPAGVERRWIREGMLVGIFAAIACTQVAATGTLKRLLDNRAGACVVLERALRTGWMKPSEQTDAPFGFVAWHLFPYYISHDGRQSADLGGFGRYVGQRCVDVHIEPTNRRDYLSHRGDETSEAPFRCVLPRGWFHYAVFSLERRKDSKPPQDPPIAAEYRYEPFPLNDAEWRQYIQPALRH